MDSYSYSFFYVIVLIEVLPRLDMPCLMYIGYIKPFSVHH